MENKLEVVIGSKFAENMKTMDKKLNDVVSENKTYAEKLKESASSSVTQNSTSINTEGNFRSIMKDQRNEELIQEQERKRRSNNLIIHGVAKMNDEFVTSFLRVIDISVKPKAILRLGNPKTANRPIKLVMDNEQEKDNIMGNLRNLKGKNEGTREEREEIKNWVNKAKSKNTEEGDSSRHVWRVRGSPKKRTSPGESRQAINKEGQIKTNLGNTNKKMFPLSCRVHLSISNTNAVRARNLSRGNKERYVAKDVILGITLITNI